MIMEDDREEGAFGSKICDLSDRGSFPIEELLCELEPLVEEEFCLLSPGEDILDKLEGRGTPMLVEEW